MSRTKPTNKARIFLAEDHAIARLGFAQLINQQPDMMVCGEAETASQALESIAKLAPNLAIVDLTLKASNGLGLIKSLAVRCPAVKILVVSMHDESMNAELAVHAGARGYIMKEEAIDKLLAAIRQVMSGKIYLSERMMQKVVEQRMTRGTETTGSGMDILSHREREVLLLIGQWRRTAEIATQLNLSVKTIESYRHRLKQKLNLQNASELTQFATEWVHQKPPH